MRLLKILALALAMTFAAWGVQAEPLQTPALTASGTPEVLAPEALDGQNAQNLQHAASVVRIDELDQAGAKMFGTAGGDPAMNGLNTYIAFYASPADGWVVFNLGNILDYTVLSSSAGRIDLDIQESTYDEASGDIGNRHRKAIVTWTAPDEFQPPTAVTVTPAD